MAELKNRYANTLFRLSEEKGTVEKDLEQAVLIRNAVNNPEEQAFLRRPDIPPSDKFKLLDKFLSGEKAEHISSFLHLMVEKHREPLIVPVLTEYIDLLNRSLRTEVKVVSAKQLTDAQLEAIQTLLSEKLKKQVYLDFSVEPDVLGGFYIMVDGRVFDCTVRTDLIKMKERLKRGNFE